MDEEEVDDDEEFDWENTTTIRTKWTWDGCSTLDEVIQACHKSIEYIKSLKDDGWELMNTVCDYYGTIERIAKRKVKREYLTFILFLLHLSGYFRFLN